MHIMEDNYNLSKKEIKLKTHNIINILILMMNILLIMKKVLIKEGLVKKVIEDLK